MPYKDPDKRREAARVRERRWRAENPEKSRAKSRRWRQQSPEKAKAAARRWREKNIEKDRAAHARYHREHPEKNNQRKHRMHEAEAGRPRPDRCEVCGGNENGIHFDHCHQRGIFRGWLCSNCNVILGYAHDDPNRLRMLIAYLERTAKLVPPQLALPGI